MVRACVDDRAWALTGEDRDRLDLMSARPPTAARKRTSREVRIGPIVLQKSKVAGRQIFRKKTEQEVIADSYNLNRVTEVACEFVVRR